jgi:gas vesicle protein
MGKGSSFGDFLTGILLGGAVGYALALLNAPRPGEETRAMLNEKSRELRERARETVQTTVDKTGKLVSEGRERLNTTFDETRSRVTDQVSDLKVRGETVLTDVRSQVSENLHRVADQVDPGEVPGGERAQGSDPVTPEI